MDGNKEMQIQTTACGEGILLPLAPENISLPLPCAAHVLHGAPVTELRAGDMLGEVSKEIFHPMLRVEGFMFAAASDRRLPLLRALCPIEAREHRCVLRHASVSAAVITLSDKGWAGKREDTCGAVLAKALSDALSAPWLQRFLLPDDPAMLKALVCELALGQRFDLVVTTGGTGLSPRDTTPEALLPLLTRRLHGFEQAMLQAGLAHTPRAALSRCLAGCVHETLLLTLPGSARGALENLSAVLPLLPHALDKLHGDMADCGEN